MNAPDKLQAVDIRRQKDRLWRYGLTVDGDDCVQLRLAATASDSRSGAQRAADGSGLAQLVPANRVFSCRVRILTPTELQQGAAMQRALRLADQIFEGIERRCPRYAKGRSSVTYLDMGYFERFYFNTDVNVSIKLDGSVVVAQGYPHWQGDVPESCLEQVSLRALGAALPREQP
jgi:hypothetical protein